MCKILELKNSVSQSKIKIDDYGFITSLGVRFIAVLKYNNKERYGLYQRESKYLGYSVWIDLNDPSKIFKDEEAVKYFEWFIPLN
jgi:hypothetical protein